MVEKVLVTAEIDKRIEKDFSQLEFTYRGYSLDEHIPLEHNELINIIPEYDVLICEFDVIDSKVIENAKKLKLIICCRGGVRSVVDVACAIKHGIVVKNTPGRNSYAVAEYVFGVMFSFDRKLFLANRLILEDSLQQRKFILPTEYRDSLWGMDINSPYHIFRGRGLHNLVLGVIGYGNIGRVVVNMAITLGIHVLVYNHHPILSPIPAGVEIVTKKELLEKSDFVSIHCNNKEGVTVIGKEELRMMKKTSILINTARGDLVDEEELISALNNNVIAGAAIDVTQKEPLPMNSPLIYAKNIFLTPHIAGAADEVIQIGTDMAIYHLRDFLNDISEGAFDE